MTIPAPDPRSSGRRALANPESRIPNPGPMQLTLERPDYDFFLRGADGASALVNERKLERSFVISPRALVEDWPVADVAAMAPADLQPLFELEPELILLGSGETQAFPPAETMAACLSQGIGLETMTNAAVARTFNVLAGEGRKVVAGFVLGACENGPPLVLAGAQGTLQYGRATWREKVW